MKNRITAFMIFCGIFACSLLALYKCASPDSMLNPIKPVLDKVYVENVNGTYIGDMLTGKFEGNGQFNFLSGERYSGTWKNSVIQGNGSVIFPQTGKYTGEFVNSKRAGKGTFTWDDGDVYSGNWVDDKMSGEGTYTFSNGCVITGTFVNNTISEGQYLYENKASTKNSETLTYWKAGIKNNIFSGKLEFRTSAGLYYIGDFSGLDGGGNAEITYQSRNKYSGALHAGQRVGTGKYVWYENGNIQAYYEGQWKDDMMNGSGKYFYSSNAYPYIEGTFEDGKPTGICTYYKNATDTFTTEWKKGKCTSIKEKTHG